MSDVDKRKESSASEMTRPSEVFRWLGRFAPAFGLSGSQVSILKDPEAYYSYLQDSSQKFKKRAVLSALYLGTGKLEQELISSFATRCSELHKSKVVSPIFLKIWL